MKGEKRLMLEEAVRLCVASWTALQLCLHGNGAPASVAELLQRNIVQFLISGRAKDVDDVEDFVIHELGTMPLQFLPAFEDGSIEEVSEEVWCLYEECSRGDFERVRALYAKSQSSGAQQSMQIVDEYDDGEDDEEWLPTAPTKKPEPALQLTAQEISDGWQLVQRR